MKSPFIISNTITSAKGVASRSVHKKVNYVFSVLIAACFLSGCRTTNKNQIVGALVANEKLEDAVKLISSFLNNDTLGQFAIKYGLGGEFPISLLEVGKDKVGIALWYCFDPASQEIFLALEQFDEYPLSGRNLYTLPITTSLGRAENVFKYPPGTNNDFKSTLDFVKENHRTTQPSGKKIGRGDVETFMTNFNEIQTKDGSKLYAKYGFAFVTENEKYELEKFREKATSAGFVRYYFGYEVERGKNHRLKNKIRLILIACDEDGKPFSLTSPDALILQSTWPPPPWN